jgi:hypothetical protein
MMMRLDDICCSKMPNIRFIPGKEAHEEIKGPNCAMMMRLICLARDRAGLTILGFLWRRMLFELFNHRIIIIEILQIILILVKRKYNFFTKNIYVKLRKLLQIGELQVQKIFYCV